jgi:hypothetical protein
LIPLVGQLLVGRVFFCRASLCWISALVDQAGAFRFRERGAYFIPMQLA